MNSMQKWNKIVEIFNKNRKAKECDIQLLWEDIFSQIFYYSKMLGFLESQKTISIGNSGSLRPDIILKKDDNPICAIELKQEKIVLTSKIENQLFSYLKQTKINTGIIIADKIYLYAYEYLKDDSEQSKIEINFEKDNIDGELFVNLLSKDSFDAKAISDFINEKINHLNNVKQIRQNLNKTFVLDALGDYLGSEYTEEEIKEALNTIEISISDKKNLSKEAVNEPEVIAPKATSDFNVKLDKDILLAGGKKASIYIRKVFIESNIISDNCNTTLAKLNKDGKRYWANPAIEFVNEDWCLILNNVKECKLFIFMIPKNSLKVEDIHTRTHNGKVLMDIEIVHSDNEFVCIASKVQYNKWLIKEIKY